MKKILTAFLCLLMVMILLVACTQPQTPPATDDPNEGDSTPPAQDEGGEDQPSNTQPETPPTQKEETMDFEFEGIISKEVLCNYLSRAVTISLEGHFAMSPTTTHIKSFILNTGAKYICRAATCWNPTGADFAYHEGQKAFIEDVHKQDPDVVFEACIFECISPGVEQFAIPTYVFEAFDLPVESRNFDYEAMCFPDGRYLGQWGENTTVPDITQPETQMFFYYRACTYMDLGFEALHLGQVHLIGATDTNWECFTRVIGLIREYADANARRGFVFVNAHTHGLIDANGLLMFDFHMYPSRPMATETETFAPSEGNPQTAEFAVGHSDSIYGKSLGGETYSGWECDSLPYLVELDNYGNDEASLFIPKPNDMRVYGMDEISWYANQPTEYREEFLEYAYEWVRNEAPGDGFFAMPGQRVATLYDENKKAYSWQYYAYDTKNHKDGFGDEIFIKEIWEDYE